MPSQPPIIFNNRLNQALTEVFYRFTQSGCGWKVYDYAVTLEPILPKISNEPIQIQPNFDDARLSNRLRLFGNPQNTQRLIETNQVTENVETPKDFYREEKPIEIQIFLPSETDISKVVCEQLLLNFGNAKTPTSYEILTSANEIIVQIACEPSKLPLVKESLKSHFSGVYFEEKQNFLESNWQNASNTVIADFGLSRNFLFPLQIPRLFNPAPLHSLFSSLSILENEEKAVFQVLFQPLTSIWSETIQKFQRNQNFKEIPESNNLSSVLKEKLSSPLFAVVIRLAVQSENPAKSWQLIKRIGGSLACFSSPNGNELIALDITGISPHNHFLSIFSRTSYRSGMILNVSELASLTHLPSASIKAEKLKRNEQKTKSAPTLALGHRLILGENLHHGQNRRVSLSNEQRTRHLHIIGSTGSGKSNLLLNLIKQDLETGEGLCVIDPHGGLIDEVISNVPESRIEDVILFDPSDSEYAIGFNILQANSELEKTLLSSDLVATFKRMSTSWGDVMDSVLANAILAIVESSRGGTLFDLKRFLVEKDFRNQFLLSVEDESVCYFWQNEFPLIGGKPQGSILIRLDAFLRQKIIRNIVCQKETRLTFREIMDNRKILLIKLSQGIIGTENSHLLGTFLVSKIHQTALSRQDTTNRPFFGLYIDEFHNFIVPSMESILSGIRKYNIGLHLSHQEFRQLQSRNQEVASSVLSNCYTRICFRLGETDAEKFASGFSSFDAKSLQNLSIGEAIARVERADCDFNLKTFLSPRVKNSTAERRRTQILQNTREKYAKPKTEVELETSDQRQNSTANSPIQRQIEPVNRELREPNSTELKSQDVKPDSIMVASGSSENREKSSNGRGGKHHQELQSVIKRMAESYGFTVEIEKSVLEGVGFVDVSLEKENLKIAAEVSVTSTADYETYNILKCLSAGYNYALVVVSNQKKISAINNKLSAAVPFELQEKVKVLSLTGLLSFLRKLAFPTAYTQKKREKPDGQRLNFTEACEFFGIGSSTLYRWIREGRIPFYRPGREYQFDRDELVLIGRHDLSGKRKATVKLEPLKIEKTAPKSKKEQDLRYRKMLRVD